MTHKHHWAQLKEHKDIPLRASQKVEFVDWGLRILWVDSWEELRNHGCRSVLIIGKIKLRIKIVGRLTSIENELQFN